MSVATRLESQAVPPETGVAAITAMCAELANFGLDFGLEDDGRVIAEIEALPGCLAYGRTREEAARKARALALKIIADKMEHGELDGYGAMANC